jgi:hypothetical protein
LHAIFQSLFNPRIYSENSKLSLEIQGWCHYPDYTLGSQQALAKGLSLSLGADMGYLAKEEI